MLRLLRLVFVLALAGAAAVVVANVIVLRGGRGSVEDAGEAPRAQVAIILGAGLDADGSPSSMLADRIAAGAELYRAGRVRRLIVSGDHGTVGYDEVDAMRRGLVERGVPDRVIFTDHAGFDTLDSMIRAKKVFGVESAVVVTQRFHVARAVWLARRQGIEATGLIADRSGYGRQGRISQVREIVARTKAVMDVVAGAEPRFLGPPIDLDGDVSRSR